jgi:hypothetical protein
MEGGGNDLVVGDSGGDFLFGDEINVNANDGNDTLDAGQDGLTEELVGGGGTNTFVENPPLLPSEWQNEEQIIDFRIGDTVQIGPFSYTFGL